MIIFPAIDIKNERVVRLVQGDFKQVQEYDWTPVTAARHWEKSGAAYIHVVDLDGAKTGALVNQKHIMDIVQAVSIPIQVGGGIRTRDDIAFLIEGGVARVVLGTKAIDDKSFLLDCINTWQEKIAVSLDCHNGMIAQHGWITTSNLKATDFVQELEILGLKCLIYTDIARDGMLTGPNYAELETLLKATKIPIIASGGIATLDDIHQLKKLESKGLLGAITGKAIYDGKLDIKEALKIAHA